MQSRDLTVDGQTVHLYHRPGSGDPVLFFHATGFHARVWDQLLARLPDADAYLVDMPGHGRSETPPLPFRWDQTGALMGTLVAALGLERVTGVGHSMGGHVLLLAAADQPERFRQLVVLDPVVIPLKAIPFMNQFDTSALARRRNDWTGSDDFLAAYQSRAPFDTWDAQVLRDYAAHALKDGEGGRMVLACAPDFEASVYQNHGAEVLHERFRDITCPVHIIRARSLGPGDKPTDFRLSPTAPTLVNKLSLATDEQHPEFTHFFPMEHPDWLAEQLRQRL